MKGELGFCLVCDMPITRDTYTEVQVEWSNGSKMNVAVCRDCAQGGLFDTEDGKRSITDWHFAYWDKKGSKYDKGITVV